MHRNTLKFNLAQAIDLVAFFGGDEADVSVAWFDAVESNAEGEAMPAGLYAWCTEYPEEGRVFLGGAE